MLSCLDRPKNRFVKKYQTSVSQDTTIDLKMLATSTNDGVRSIAGDSRWCVCMAEYQSAGRGRRGRVWQSPFGASLYFSMLWKIEGGLGAIEGLSLAVGLAVLKTLESSGVRGLTLKWPNDVLKDGRKLAGVLLEISGDPTGSCEVVIGIGINLILGLEQRSKIDQPVTDVKTSAGMNISKNKIAGRLIANLADMLTTFQSYGFTPYKEQWQQYDAFAGQSVSLFIGESVVTGIAAGVNDSGAVLLKNNAGVTAYAGGEISLRKL